MLFLEDDALSCASGVVCVVVVVVLSLEINRPRESRAHALYPFLFCA